MLRVNCYVIAFLCFGKANSYLIIEDSLPGNSSIVDDYLYIGAKKHAAINSGRVPDDFDWRDKNMVSPVKDQGSCAACWAFSAVANIESHVKIYTGVEENLSEQFLIDCDPSKAGCGSAGLIQTFANIVSKLRGVLRVMDYFPYVEQRMSCRWNWKVPHVVPVVGYRRVKPMDEVAMVLALYQQGPLSAAINDATMVKYKGNYIDMPSEEDCPTARDNLNHAILIVGYNVYVDQNSGDKVPYWIIKNSWGKSWGDSGFYYLERGRNACGIASDVSYAFVH